jgi:magnesium transporter
MLVNCAAYENGKKLADISLDEIKLYKSRPNSFVWVALKDVEPGELEILQEEFDLHELAVEDAHHGHQRPKMDEYGQSLFVVLQIVEPVENELHTGEIAIFVGPKYVVSVRRDYAHGFSDVRKRSEMEPELLRHGPAYVLYALMDAVVDRYFPVLDGLTEEIDLIEERIFSGPSTREHIEALYGLKRKLMVLDRATSPLLEVTSKLHGGRVPHVCSGLDEYFRDVYDHLLRVKASIDSLRDMTTTATAVNLSLIGLQETEITKRLAAYAALAAVPTMIAGVYGMNFEHMPELGWIYGYPFAISLMLGIDAYLVYMFKKAKWL